MYIDQPFRLFPPPPPKSPCRQTGPSLVSLSLFYTVASFVSQCPKHHSSISLSTPPPPTPLIHSFIHSHVWKRNSVIPLRWGLAANSHEGWMEPRWPELVCRWIPVAVGGGQQRESCCFRFLHYGFRGACGWPLCATGYWTRQAFLGLIQQGSSAVEPSIIKKLDHDRIWE